MATRGVNRVTIMGHLGNDPDVRYMPNGDPVANFSIATSEVWTDKATNQKREETDWHRIVAFRRLAEIVSQFCHKGSKLYVEGRLQTRKWTDQDGIDHYVTEVIANNVQLVDSKQGSSHPPPHGEKRPPAQGNAATAAGANPQGSKQTPPPGHVMDEEPPLPSEIPNYEGMDDDIPF